MDCHCYLPIIMHFNSADGITHAFADTTNRRIGIALLLFASVALVWTVYSGIKKWQFVESSVVTVGTVENMTPLVISFVAEDGATVRFEQGWKDKGFPSHLGQSVEVIYSSKNPEQAEMTNNLWTGQIFGAVASAVFLFWGFALRNGYAVAGPLRRTRVGIKF